MYLSRRYYQSRRRMFRVLLLHGTDSINIDSESREKKGFTTFSKQGRTLRHMLTKIEWMFVFSTSFKNLIYQLD